MFSIKYALRRKVDQIYKPVILVTGCSSGIGLALAELLLHQENYRIVITARSESIASLRERFSETDRFIIRELDVTNDAHRRSLIQEIESKWRGVDILINNAGISYRAVFEHMSEDDEQKQMATNYFGPAALIRLILPAMRGRGRGKIISVSSVSGMLAMPTMASYSASKYALEGMSEALWYETKPFGINVSLIQPGFIRSLSFKNVRYTDKSLEMFKTRGPYSDYYHFMTPFIERLMSWSLTDPMAISKCILKVIKTENPPLWIAATLDAWVFYYLRRLVPRKILLPLLFWALPHSHRWAKDFTNRRKAS